MAVAVVLAAAPGCSDPNAPGASSTGGTIDADSLAAAREKVAAGAGEVDLAPDGSVKYRHRLDGDGADVEELDVDGRVVLRWVREGLVGHMDQDTHGDGMRPLACSRWRTSSIASRPTRLRWSIPARSR